MKTMLVAFTLLILPAAAVNAAATKMAPPLGLSAWAAFTKAGAHAVVMGDMVLTDDQVNPGMSASLDNGLQVTALHNHFFWEQPRVMFMHIGGMGDEAKLAAGVAKVFEAMKQKFDVPSAAVDPASTTLDPRKIEATRVGKDGGPGARAEERAGPDAKLRALTPPGYRSAS